MAQRPADETSLQGVVGGSCDDSPAAPYCAMGNEFLQTYRDVIPLVNRMRSEETDILPSGCFQAQIEREWRFLFLIDQHPHSRIASSNAFEDLSRAIIGVAIDG